MELWWEIDSMLDSFKLIFNIEKQGERRAFTSR